VSSELISILYNGIGHSGGGSVLFARAALVQCDPPKQEDRFSNSWHCETNKHVPIAREKEKQVPISAYTRMSTLSTVERTVSNVKLAIQIRDLKLETLANKIP
jgi:hypothetical protein